LTGKTYVCIHETFGDTMKKFPYTILCIETVFIEYA